MKNHSPLSYSLLGAFLLLQSASLSSAATTLITFGSGYTAPGGVTVNSYGTGASFADMGGAATFLDTTGATSFTVDLGGGQNFGNGGSFVERAGSITYNGSNSLVNAWNASYVPTYGNIWQRGVSSNGTETSTTTFSNLLANTTYTFTLLSDRANAYVGGNGTYALTYAGGTSGITTELVAGSQGTVAATTVTGAFSGDAAGANAREIRWTFTTGSTADNVVLTLGGAWNMNAIIVDTVAIPEPSVALLGGLGVLGLLRRRRN